ncbi:hypothetical protein ACSNOI_37875 [Actinomadura kijaniata]|uniref:hypothetical protein n=1 Tax=Actinomadura kijaniata TaxID=46161 RepID=UPI003F1D58F7
MRIILGTAVALASFAVVPVAAAASAEAATAWKTGNNLRCVAGKGSYQRTGRGQVILDVRISDSCRGGEYAAIVFKATGARGKVSYSGFYSPVARRHNVRDVKVPFAMPVRRDGHLDNWRVQHLYVKECTVVFKDRAKKKIKTFRHCGPAGYKKIF